jgi:23S rRNA (uracil1939-C5)-methyltransferase
MDTINVKIEKLVYGGDGLGHSDGQTIFAPYVLPEEVVRVEPVERKKKFVRGRVRELVTPSPTRVAATCRHFGVCGGCHYQHIPYATQLEYKTEILRESLRRIGRIEWTGLITAHASPPFGYRNRAQWKIRPVAGSSGAASIGYFQSATTVLTPVEECPILSPRLTAVLDALRQLLADRALPSSIQEIEAFADSADARVLLNISLVRPEGSSSAISQTLRAAIPAVESILFHDAQNDRFNLDGPGYIHYDAAGNRLRVGHLSFFQTNRFVIDDLTRAVAGESAGKLAFDLFAGVGLFSLALVRHFVRVVAVDSNLAAVSDLKSNIDVTGAAAQPVNMTAEGFLATTSEVPDLLVLDPPRAGVAPEALARILALMPPRITYLSCDPATLGRDLAVLTGAPAPQPGYHIRELMLWDIFPETYHIETLVRLERHG